MNDIIGWILLIAFGMFLVWLQHKIYNRGGFFKFWLITIWIASFILPFIIGIEYIMLLGVCLVGMLAVHFIRTEDSENGLTIINIVQENLHIH